MAAVAWEAGRAVRGTLSREYRVRVTVKCACGRTLGFLYGSHDQLREFYTKGSIPFKITANPSRDFAGDVVSPFVCQGGHGDYRPSRETLEAAYRDAAARPQHTLIMPYDLQAVSRR
jgi:hypothetical protein